jgi:hypothetical protein
VDETTLWRLKLLNQVKGFISEFGCSDFIIGKFDDSTNVSRRITPAMTFNIDTLSGVLVLLNKEEELSNEVIESLQILVNKWARDEIGIMMIGVPNIQSIKYLQCSNIFADIWVLYEPKPDEWWFEDRAKNLIFVFDDAEEDMLV